MAFQERRSSALKIWQRQAHAFFDADQPPLPARVIYLEQTKNGASEVRTSGFSVKYVRRVWRAWPRTDRWHCVVGPVSHSLHSSAMLWMSFWTVARLNQFSMGHARISGYLAWSKIGVQDHATHNTRTHTHRTHGPSTLHPNIPGVSFIFITMPAVFT